jgi:hypothetical protein
MSFYDLNKLSERELIGQFILESRGIGAFLSYTDCQIIENWIRAAKGDTDLILFLLSKKLGKTKEESPTTYRSLKFFEKKILLEIRNSQTKLS